MCVRSVHSVIHLLSLTLTPRQIDKHIMKWNKWTVRRPIPSHSHMHTPTGSECAPQSICSFRCFDLKLTFRVCLLRFSLSLLPAPPLCSAFRSYLSLSTSSSPHINILLKCNNINGFLAQLNSNST